MFLGHYAVALGAKRAAPGTSLGTLFLAVQFLDLLWPILLLAGLERVRIAPGLMAANSLDFVHYPISHSLLAAAGWALLLGIGYYAVRRYAAGAWVVGAAVLSHWFLDLPMHRPDLPLWPDSPVRVGGGLWDSVPLTLAIEFGLLTLGLVLYLRATTPRDRIGSWGLWTMVALLALFFLGGTLGPPPPSESALAVGGLALWLFVPWAYWVDRHRVPVATPAANPQREVDPVATTDLSASAESRG
jgi:hypothetical protein